MGSKDNPIDALRAAVEPRGVFLRGAALFDGDGPVLDHGGAARTVLLLGNIGGSLWPAFSRWRDGREDRGGENPLDLWSVEIIQPVADRLGATAYFPSRQPWQPFQQWAIKAEGLKASPLGILIHPEYGLWHGYRAALGFAETVDCKVTPPRAHPCDSCVDKPCLTTCPASAVEAARFDVGACRSHLATEAGKAGCIQAGCLARNVCPVGARFRYPVAQLRFHMAALGGI